MLKWFARFHDFDVEDAELSGRPSTVDPQKITTLMKANPHLRTDKIRDMIDVSHGSVVNHLKQRWICEESVNVGATST